MRFFYYVKHTLLAKKILCNSSHGDISEVFVYNVVALSSYLFRSMKFHRLPTILVVAQRVRVADKITYCMRDLPVALFQLVQRFWSDSSNVRGLMSITNGYFLKPLKHNSMIYNTVNILRKLWLHTTY